MKKILIVDDEPDQILTLKFLFKEYEEQYELVEAENGNKCLEVLEHGLNPDVILLDIMMPEMSGWEVFDKIKDNPNWSNIPVVFLTARTDDLAQDAGQILADDYIEKPFEIQDLLNRIERVIKKP
jgi:CheY-like chemotaxis protein